MNDKIFRIACVFNLEGKIKEVKPYGTGLINNTYLIITDKMKYILQKINTYVFTNPNNLVENIFNVTKYIKEKSGNTLEIVKTKENKLLYEIGNDYYRCYKMKEKYYTIDLINIQKYAHSVGKTISKFQEILNEYDVSKLHITIPFFHDLRHRYIDLIKAYRKSLDINKNKECSLIIKKYLEEFKTVMNLPVLYEKGIIKQRVCHYDTKLNNFLFLKEEGCLIDLDTVMPGCSIYDFGDCARNIVFNCQEDEYLKDIEIDLKCFSSLLLGYLSVGKNYLSKIEIENIINSMKVITLELSIRFLTDYLENDVYFKTKYSKHNYHRAICQLNIYNNIVKNEGTLNKIVNNCYERIK